MSKTKPIRNLVMAGDKTQTADHGVITFNGDGVASVSEETFAFLIGLPGYEAVNPEDAPPAPVADAPAAAAFAELVPARLEARAPSITECAGAFVMWPDADKIAFLKAIGPSIPKVPQGGGPKTGEKTDKGDKDEKKPDGKTPPQTPPTPPAEGATGGGDGTGGNTGEATGP